MASNAAILELAALASRLGKLRVVSEENIATQGFMLGAIYALRQASTLGYVDSRNLAGRDVLAPEFVRVATALSTDQSPESTWLAGFYFISALMRIAALNEKLDKMAGKKINSAVNVRRIVNQLKHETDAHVRGDWEITYIEALQSLRGLCQQFEVLTGVQHDG